MGLAITRTAQARIVTPLLINIRTFQIGEPRLDVPRGNDNGDSVILLPRFDALRLAGTVQLFQPAGNARAIAIHKNNEALRDSMAIHSVGCQLSWKALANELLGGPSSGWGNLNPQSPRGPARLFQESPGE